MGPSNHLRSRAWLEPAVLLDQLWFRAADARVYGVLRIALACAGFGNLLTLWPERYRLFAVDGSLAPLVSLRDSGEPTQLSVFHGLDSHLGVDLVIAIAALSLLTLAFGVAPRSSAIVAWLFHLNYTRWAFYDLTGWDNLLRAAFFVLAVSPGGTPYRLWRRSPESPLPRELPRYGLVLMRWQVLVMYASAAWLKAGNGYWRRGDVLGYFHSSVFSRIDLEWSFAFPATLALLAYGTMVVELALPFLLWSKRTRALGFVLGCGLHGWVALTTTVGIFSLVVLATYAAFLDGEDVDRIEKRCSSSWAWLRRRLHSSSSRSR